MDNIIEFRRYNWKKGDLMIFEKLLLELKEKNKSGHQYPLAEIRKIANDILSMSGFYSGRCATPIVKIAKEFDFKTYKETLPDKKSGDIHINGNTSEKYGHDKVILVNKEEELFHQRFVVAHELAHYLFEFLGNPKYSDPSIIFVEPYQKDRHETMQEIRANTFAAEIMMPRELFIEQFHIARRENSNRMFLLMYLSRYFETSIDSIERRIAEVL